MAEKSLYSEVKKRKMEALGKQKIVEAVEKHGKILSIKGQYDQPDKVMNHAYAAVKDTIRPDQFNKVTLDTYDLVVIGCPGNEIPAQYHVRFREYVERGGWILSTDWVLRTIVEPIFPGFISWNGEKTADAVVACEIVDPNHPFMHGVIDSLKSYKGSDSDNLGPKSAKAAIPGLQPTFKWWLEDKSFPITVLRKGDVKVLIKSYEIGKKWGADPVFVYFPFGKGLVAHFISHTHLQKGASKGKFASAIILTNLLDECIKAKYGLGSSQRSGYQDPNAVHGLQSAAPAWDQAYTPVGDGGSGSSGAAWNEPAMPVPDPSQGIVPDFGGIAQAVEIQVLQDPNVACPACAQGFMEGGRMFECNACHAVYHEHCIQQQVNTEGTCRQCGNVLLF